MGPLAKSMGVATTYWILKDETPSDLYQKSSETIDDFDVGQHDLTDPGIPGPL